MPTNPANATELATITRSLGSEVLEGDLRYPSLTGNWATSTWASTWTATVSLS